MVHVTAVDRHDPPLDTGWLPRPRLTASVPRRGLSYREFPDESHLDGSGYALDGERIPSAGPYQETVRHWTSLTGAPPTPCECCDRMGSPGR